MERLKQDQHYKGACDPIPLRPHAGAPGAASFRPNRLEKGGLGDDIPGIRPKHLGNKKPPPSKSSLRSSSQSSKGSTVVRVSVSSSPLPVDGQSDDELDVMSASEDGPAQTPKASPRSKSSKDRGSKPGPTLAPVREVSSSPAKARKPRPKAKPVPPKTVAERDSDEDIPTDTLTLNSNTPSRSRAGPAKFPMSLTKGKQSEGTAESSTSLSTAVRPLPMVLPSTKAKVDARATIGIDTASSDHAGPKPIPFELPPAKAKPPAAPSLNAFPMGLPARDKLADPANLARTASSSSSAATSSKLSSKVQAFPMDLPSLPSRDAAGSQARGKKRGSPKGKERADNAERATKRPKTDKVDPTDARRDEELSDDMEAIGSLGSMRLDSSQSSLDSYLDEDDRELCPFCDEPWPEHPSERLLKLRTQVERKAWKDPRYGNPKGLTAPIEVFVGLCNLHRSESRYIPEGIAQGWPTSIDFKAIPGRLRAQKKRLSRIVQDPSGVPFFQAARNDIIEKGARVAASAIGQFQTFERSQPGYYGEQGLAVILRAVDSMFPEIPLTACHPLQPDDFIRQVLVPEAAILLIKEDMHVDRSKALPILIASRKYGLAQFPDRESGVEGGSQLRETQRPASPAKAEEMLAVRSSASPSGLKSKSKGKENPVQKSEPQQRSQPLSATEKKAKPRPRPVTAHNKNSWLLSSQSVDEEPSFEL